MGLSSYGDSQPGSSTSIGVRCICVHRADCSRGRPCRRRPTSYPAAQKSSTSDDEDAASSAVVRSSLVSEWSYTPGFPRRPAEHHAGARRTTHRRDAIGLGERQALGRERIEIRGDGAGMIAQEPDPVVAVVERDEQHVGCVGGGGRRRIDARRRSTGGPDFVDGLRSKRDRAGTDRGGGRGARAEQELPAFHRGQNRASCCHRSTSVVVAERLEPSRRATIDGSRATAAGRCAVRADGDVTLGVHPLDVDTAGR